MKKYPKLEVTIGPDFLDQFPDGTYTIGRGADPRSAADIAADPDGSIALAKWDREQAEKAALAAEAAQCARPDAAE